MVESRLPLHVRILQQTLEERKSKNAQYSMRALARDLDIDPAALSRILSGKQELSLETCRAVLSRLQLPPVKMRLFIASVAEDKRNRASAALIRTIEPHYLVETEVNRDAEKVLDPKEAHPLAVHDVLALEKDLVSVTDLDGRFLFVNEAVARAFGTVPCELIGETWNSNIFDIDDTDLLDLQLRETIASKKEMTFEFRSPRTARHFRRVVTPMFGADRQLNSLISTFRDVTWDRFLQLAAVDVHSSIDLKTVIERAVETPLPLLGTIAAVCYKSSVATRGLSGSEKPLIDLLENWSAAPARIEELSSHQMRAFGSNGPSHALVCPLHDAGMLVILTTRPPADIEIRIATEYAKIVSQALRNADTCSKTA